MLLTNELLKVVHARSTLTFFSIWNRTEKRCFPFWCCSITRDEIDLPSFLCSFHPSHADMLLDRIQKSSLYNSRQHSVEISQCLALRHLASSQKPLAKFPSAGSTQELLTSANFSTMSYFSPLATEVCNKQDLVRRKSLTLSSWLKVVISFYSNLCYGWYECERIFQRLVIISTGYRLVAEVPNCWWK